MADGEVPEAEMNILTQLCECMQIPLTKIDDFVALSEAANAIYKKGEELIFQN